jgi:SpoIID/LytB domain protein
MTRSASTERACRAVTRVAAVAIVAAILVPAQSLTARAADSFTFHGSGWGHGAGISQYGLLGLAKKGWGYDAVLKHYYEGVGIGLASAPSLRIGLVQNEDVLHLAASGGVVRLKLGSAGGDIVGEIPAGETWTVRVASDKYVIRDASGVQVGAPVGGTAQHLFVTFATGARVSIPEAGHTYNRGNVEFNIYSGVLRAIAVLPVQSYLYGLGEVPSSWPDVALRAQATAARTYALEKVSRLGQNRLPCNCGLLDSVADQNYVGYEKEAGFMGSRWVGAVDATSGHVLRSDGSLIQAFYSSSSGGYTEHSENVFSEKLSYIRATCDPGDYTEENPNRVWKVGPVSADSLTASLASKTGNIGTITDFRKAERGPSDRLLWVTVVGETGEKRIRGGDIRSALNLKSTRFFINRNLNVTGAIRARYDSVLCRPGSATTPQRAATGGSFQRFEKGAIYRNEDPGATVWLRGAIYEKYVAKQEWAGVLRWPISSTRRLRAGACKRWRCSATSFERGRIYYKSKAGVGVHALWGPVSRYFEQIGGVFGGLGFPITDVVRSNGSSSARFERGTIRCDRYGICRS